jgi:hypothetical protein
MTNPAVPPSAPSSATPETPVKDAEIVSRPAKAAVQDPALAPKQLTFTQHLFIWSMVVVVGVLFGVGSSWTFLQHTSNATVGGIPESELMPRMDVGRRLQAILPREKIDFGGEAGWARMLREARLAQSQGLMPKGAGLDVVVEDFLNKSIDTGRTVRDLLAERVGTKTGVTRQELAKYLAERRASEALIAARLVVPAVAQSAGDELIRMQGTRLQAEQVVLSAANILAGIKIDGDDPELPQAYERLKGRFSTPASATLSVARADLPALMAKHRPDAAAIKAAYEADPSRWTVPAPEGSLSAPTVRTLEQVSAALADELAQPKADAEAQQLIQRFNDEVEGLGLDRSDAARFAEAARAKGLVVSILTIQQTGEAVLDLADLGRVPDPAGLFAKDLGYISNPLQGTGTSKAWFIARLDAKTAATVRPLDQVKSTVQQELAASRAWPLLVEQAEKLRVELEAKGPGALKAWAASDAAKVWDAKLTTVPLMPWQPLVKPSTQPGLEAGDKVQAMALAVAARPVALTNAEQGSGLSVRLLQVSSVEFNPLPANEEMNAHFADTYRQGLERLRAELLSKDLLKELGDGR